MDIKTSRLVQKVTIEVAFRWLVVVAGVGLLLLTSFVFPSQFRLDVAAVIFLFVAFQVNFPLTLSGSEISLVQAISMGSGLLYGPVTAGWATSIGILAGYAVRRYWPGSPAHHITGQPFSWPEAWLAVGMNNLAITTAMVPFGYTIPYIDRPTSASLLEALASLASPALAYATMHGLLFVADLLLCRRRSLTRLGLVTLMLFEVVPILFTLIAVASYPAVQIGSLIMLGGIPVIYSILIYNVGSTRANLERRVQDLSTLNQISEVLRTTLDLEDLYSVIHVQVSQLLNVDNFYIALYDEEKDLVSYPLAVKRGQRQQWAPRSLQNQLTDRVIRERTPILFSPNSPEASHDISLPRSDVTPTAWLGVPLISPERTIGCLALFSLSSGTRFTQHDLNLLLILSGQASIAIENALHYRQAQRRTAQLETLTRLSAMISASLDPQKVLEQVCRSVTQVGGGSRSAIYLLDPEQNLVYMAYTYQLSVSFQRRNHSFSTAHNGRTRCLRTGRAVLTPNLNDTDLEYEFIQSLREENIQAFGDFPLITPEGQIGFLSVYRTLSLPFTAEEVDLLQTLASEAAVAVANARLYANTDLALSQRARQLSILESVGRELAAATHSDRLFEMILNYARDYTNSFVGHIGIYDPGNLCIEIRASFGYKGILDYYSVETGISGRAIRTRHPCNVGDVHQDRDYQDIMDGAASSQLSVPLIHEGRVVGLITLESLQLNGYSENDELFISQLANQAAVAVVNAELYKETQRRLREQSTLYLVSTRLGGELEAGNVLKIIQRAVYAYLEDSQVGVYLWNADDQVYYLQPGDPGISPTLSATIERLKGPFLLPASHMPEAINARDLAGFSQSLSQPIPLQFQSDSIEPAALRAQCIDCQVLAFPLIAAQQRLGMLLVHRPPQSVPLQEEGLQLMRAIISQGAISLQNALLFSDVMQTRDRLASVLNSVGEGIIMIEMSGRILVVNESTSALTGLTASELTGQYLTELPSSALQLLGYTPSQVREFVNALSNGIVSAEVKLTIQLAEMKPERFLERTTWPVWGHQGKAIGWMIVLRDVTEEHQIAQAREMITETLVHDLRSPISAIMGALDVVEEDLRTIGNAGISSQALDVARRGGKRVLGMIEALLDISRMQSGRMDLTPTEVDLHHLAGTLMGEYMHQASEYGVYLRNEILPETPRVHVDQGKITRVLTNLLDNALKFTPSGGVVAFSAEVYTDGMVAVRVSDTGPGIPEEFREKIFERFTQVPGLRGRRRGSGLGLTFCRLAVEAHGGSISVTPRPGGGSIFTLTLPLGRLERGA